MQQELVRTTPLVITGIDSASNYTVDESDLPAIFAAMRGLYSNTHLAVLREISCNAMDAHVEAHTPELPIQVQLPTYEVPELYIRDFGPGLSHERVMDVLRKFGKSTKRDDANQTGSYGFGAKSPFAYADMWTFTSWYGGVRTVYVSTLESTGLGAIVPMTSEPSDEPSGVEVRLPVELGDVKSFQENADRFFRHFEPRPEFVGYSPVESLRLIERGETWAMYQKPSNEYGHERSHFVRMGRVCYRLDYAAIPEFRGKGWIMSITDRTIVLEAPANTVDIPPSRESLKYTPKTVAFVESVVNAFREELETKLRESLDSAPSLFAAMTRMVEMRAVYPGSKGLTFKYGEQDISHWEGVRLPGYLQVWGVPNRNWSENRWHDRSTIVPGDVLILLASIDDKRAKARVRAAQSQGGAIPELTKDKWPKMATDVYLYRGDDAEIADFIENDGFGMPYLDIRVFEIPKPVRKPSDRVKTIVDSFRRKQRVFAFDPAAGDVACADRWSPVDADPDQPALYVEIERWAMMGVPNRGWPTHSPKNVLGTLAEMVCLLQEFGPSMPPVYGVKKGTPVGPKWVKALDYAKKACKRIENAQEFIDAGTHDAMCGDGLRMWAGFTNLGFDSDHPLSRYARFKEMVDAGVHGTKRVRDYGRLRALAGLEKIVYGANTHHFTDEIARELQARYPLAWGTVRDNWRLAVEQTANVLEYIEFREEKLTMKAAFDRIMASIDLNDIGNETEEESVRITV